MHCNIVMPDISGIHFGKAVKTKDKPEYKKTLKEAKKALGIEKGLSLLKLDAASLPSLRKEDTGIGKLNSDLAIECIDYLSFYLGTNAVKTFSFGQNTDTENSYYCPYRKTALTIGEDQINLFSLASEEYGNILDKKDALQFVNSKLNPSRVNFENELGKTENYPILKPLRKAFENFKLGKSTPQLEKEFEEFKSDPFVEKNYTRLALYPFLGKKDPYLFKNFNNSREKQIRFEKYKKEYKDEIEFFKFRQFIAQKEFHKGKEKINQKGKKLFGDCLIGFSKGEVWSHPDAFVENGSVGWSLPALKPEEILKPGLEANKLFNDKISFYLKNFDGIRFDVGWWYAIAKVKYDNGSSKNYDMKREIYDFVKKRVKEIKGKDFDTKNLIWEMDGFDELFSWDRNYPQLLENTRGIVKVLTTEYEHSNGFGWGNPEFLKSAGLKEDEFIIGTNNHDGANLKHLAESNDPEMVKRREDSAVALSKALNIPKEKILSNSKEFIKAKFAELFTTKNQFFYFIDVLGSDYDNEDHTGNPGSYRFRIDRDFERQYHTALQNGEGLNAMEALRIALKAKNLDRTNPSLYSRVSFWANYLRKPGAKTEQEANLEGE